MWRGDELWNVPGRRLLVEPGWRTELDAAMVRARDLPLDAIDRTGFALPTMAPALADVRRRLEEDAGVVWLRGLPIADRSEDDIARMFWGLAQHIGAPVSQSAAGDRLLRVRDERFGKGDPRVRGPHTNRELAFHTDRCDVIAFCCVRAAKRGGDNHLLSSAALYNEMLRRHPESVPVLRRTFPYLRHTVDGGNERPFTEVPVFTSCEGQFAASLLRVLIDRADRSPDAPDLSPAQRQALDELQAVAEDSSLYATLRLEPGDVLLLNNWVTMHRRSGFEDHEEPGRRRLLLRLWLAPPNSRPLDPRFSEHFGATGAGALRGGMRPR